MLENIKNSKEDPLHLNSRVLLVDSMNTFLRSFAMINHMNPGGAHIGGLTGFLKSIGFAIRHIKPTRVILVFDGTGSYVTCNIPLSGDITYCFWLKTGVVQNNKRIINITNGATNRNFSLGTTTTAGIVGGYDGTNQPLTSTRVDDNIWHNIAFINILFI
jgi:hypothetical protein